jgi:hypothetical protein
MSLFLISPFCCRGLFRYKKACGKPYNPYAVLGIRIRIAIKFWIRIHNTEPRVWLELVGFRTRLGNISHLRHFIVIEAKAYLRKLIVLCVGDKLLE